MVISTVHHSNHNKSCFGIQLNHVDPLEDRWFVNLISAVLSDLHIHCCFLNPLHKVGGNYRNVLRLSVCVSVRPSICVSVRPSICLSVTICVRAITYLCIDGLPYNLVCIIILIETMCSDLDPVPYLKGQGHTGQLKFRVHMLVSAL